LSDPAATRRLAVGRIDRAHGLRGELVVTLTTNRHERLDAGARLYTDDEILIVEPDEVSSPEARREEYAQLFAKLRHG